MSSSSGSPLAEHYSDEFYSDQIAGSLRSAKIYASQLFSTWQPRSVVDVGCGRGTWLKAFGDAGAQRLVGIDGPWNSKEKMIDARIEFRGVDLRRLEVNGSQERFDLAISLEVAEHLEEGYARAFVSGLTTLADAVLFGAAFVAQGGTNHLNEQPHSFWGRLFQEGGYQPFDLFRASLWGNREIDFWYVQNTFLYLRDDSPVAHLLKQSGVHELKDVDFMDCIHPSLYQLKLREIENLRAALTQSKKRKEALKTLLPPMGVALIQRAKSVLR